MAIGRRITKGTSLKPNLVYPTIPNTNEERPIYEMKHIRIPDLPKESSLMFEVILCLHASLFTALQFVHLYRTVWWLPQSFNSVGVNFFLIDPNILVFIVAVLSRRVIYLALKAVTPVFSLHILQVFLVIPLLMLTVLSSYKMSMERGYIFIAYLFVPYIWYFYVFGLSISSLWEIHELDQPSPSTLQYHVCSNEAEVIRAEVENLRKHFNGRLKKIIALASFVTYYSTFLPWCCAQACIHYDLWFVSQHLLFSWLVVFSLLLSRTFSPSFSDSMHKVACHLGKWTNLSGLRPNHIPSQLWSAELVFPPGSIVKHQRELYKAEGLICAASEPGNVTHQRFQSLFNGSAFPKALLGFHVSLVLMGIIILVRTTEWYQVISVSCLITSSLYTLIRLLVNFLVLFKMYQAEEILIRHGH